MNIVRATARIELRIRFVAPDRIGDHHLCDLVRLAQQAAEGAALEVLNRVGKVAGSEATAAVTSEVMRGS